MTVKTSVELGEVEAIHEDTVQEFQNKIVGITNQNTANCENYFRKKLRLKVWKSWLKIRLYTKIKHAKASEA